MDSATAFAAAESNKVLSPGQFVKTLVPHFAPMRERHAGVGGGAEAVAAVDDVMATLQDAFEKQEYYTNVEVGVTKIPEVGDEMKAECKGEYYPVEILSVKREGGIQVKIHWIGYDDSWDEWIDPSRLRD